MDLIADLDARGLVHDTTDLDALREMLDAGHTRFYWGLDPTADSLHIGNLVGILVVWRFQAYGHRPVILAGGATGMIGDPSGRSDERTFLDDSALASNLAAIRRQLSAMVSFEGDAAAILVDNATWTSAVTLPEFLRDVGKFVTVNQMMGKESVRTRLEGEAGISFTEFSYMLLQANDYHWLHEHEGCTLQIGGSDQWGNIVTGIDLVRRRSGAQVHGLTWPLLTRSDGRKFGKSQAGNVWLGRDRTSEFAFYQYWMQVPDADVRRFLLQLTLLDVGECHAIADAHESSPHERAGQRRLAEEITTFVHGAEAAEAAEAASALLFGGALADAPQSAYALLEAELEVTDLSANRLESGVALLDLAVECGLASSKGDARRNLGGLYLNGAPVAGDAPTVSASDLQHDRWILLRKGKRTYRLVRQV